MAKTKFELGDRVRMTGTAQKQERVRKITYAEAPIPKTNFYPNPKSYDEGIIVGSRTVMNGEVDFDTWTFCPEHGTSVQVWLVAYMLRRKPVMCFEHQIEKIDTQAELLDRIERLKWTTDDQHLGETEVVALEDAQRLMRGELDG